MKVEEMSKDEQEERHSRKEVQCVGKVNEVLCQILEKSVVCLVEPA